MSKSAGKKGGRIKEIRGNHGVSPGTQLHPRAWPNAEAKFRDWSGCKARDGYCVLVRTDVTHGSPSAGNKNAARRKKGDTMETQWARVDDWATWKERERGRGK